MGLRRLASRSRPAWPPNRSFFNRPRGFVDSPSAGSRLVREPAHFIGWCLIPGTTVVRVEVAIGDLPPERARIGIERLDIRDFSPHPDAAICGFEHKIDLALLPRTATEVEVKVVAYAADGRELELPSHTVELVDPPAPVVDETRAAELRERSARTTVVHERPRHGPVRLVAFAHQLDYSGGSLYLFELLRRLDAECHVVAHYDGPLRPELERAGIPVHVTDGFPITNAERYEGHQAELMAWAAARDFDVALVNTMGCFPGADVATRLGIPFVWAIHESFSLRDYWYTAYPPGALDPYARGRAEQLLHEARTLLFEAEATRRLYLPNAPHERLRTLPYGIELGAIEAELEASRRAELRRARGIADGTRVVLCLGTIEARKAQNALAVAFHRIADRHPDAQLVLVGESQADYCVEYAAALRDYVDRHGLGGRVRVEPVTPDPYSWHAVADLLVCSSDVESLPRVILEAMAFGTPVLSTSVFGIPELIEHGRTGYLCEPRDVVALGRALDEVLSLDRGELAAVADAAAAHVRRCHDPARYAAQVEAILHDLAARRRDFRREAVA